MDPRYTIVSSFDNTSKKIKTSSEKYSKGKTGGLLYETNIENSLLKTLKERTSKFITDIKHIATAKREIYVIIHPDEREPVFEAEYPYKCICLLKITDQNGQTHYGTGFMISETCVITSGHCVYNKVRKKWMDKIEVIPGAVGTLAPYGSATSTEFNSVEGWVLKGLENFDHGAIFLKPNSFSKNFTSYLSFKVIEKEKQVEVSGYGIDKKGTQWKSSGEAKHQSKFRIYHQIDTEKGNSGSPLYIRRGTDRIVIGVHSYGLENEKKNYGIKVTSEVFSVWQEWSKTKT